MIAIKTNGNSFIRPLIYADKIERITESRTPYDINKISDPRRIRPQDVLQMVIEYIDNTIDRNEKQITKYTAKIHTVQAEIKALTDKLDHLYNEPYSEVVEIIPGIERELSLAQANVDDAKLNIDGYNKSNSRLKYLQKQQLNLVNIIAK